MSLEVSTGKTLRDWLTASAAIAALTLSVINFAIQQSERRAKADEDVPLLGFNFEFPSVSDTYGFFLENRGNKRAHIKFVELFTVNEVVKGEAQSLLDNIGFNENEYYNPKFGPNYSMPAGARVSFYTFKKKLTDAQQQMFIEYVTKLKAEVCYCNSSGENCSIHIVSVKREVIERGPATKRSCTTS